MEQKDVLKALQRDHAAELKLAAERLKGTARHTEIIPSPVLSEMTGHEILLKPENLQVTGSFKIRGAYNKIASLTEEQIAHGIVTASAGNHAQGVALGSRMAHCKSTVVMPEGAPLAKAEATKGYGAEVVLYGKTFDESLAKAQEIQQETGAYFVHPYDDPAVIAGQGTIGLEILEQNPYIESIVVPVGGGGLLAGIAAAVKQVNPKVKVYGVQTEQAPAMYLCKKENKWVSHGVGRTIADGIAVGMPGKLTWKLISQYVDDMLLVNEEDICAAMLLMLERGKMVVEGAGAAPLAALLHHIVPGSDRAAAVVSGGNIDVNTISQIIERGLVRTGRRVKLVTWMMDRPGELLKFVSYLEEMKINILYINHDRADRSVPLGVTRVELDLETRNAQHAKEVADTLRKAGYKIEMR